MSKGIFTRIVKLLTSLTMLTNLPNFLKGCELGKRVLHLGVEEVIGKS